MTVTLASVGATYGGLTGKSGKDFGHGAGRYVTFSEVMADARLAGKSLERVDVHRSERQNEVRRGDVLFNGSSETPDEVALAAVVDFAVPEGVYLNSFCFGYRLRRADAIDPTYLSYFFRSSAGRKVVFGLAQGATRYNIAKTKLLEVPLALPPFEEQRAGAAALTQVDDLISRIAALIAKKRAIRQGMMQELLAGRTRLPGFSEPWRVIRLGDHVSYVRNVALSRAQLDSSSPLRYLHYGDIHTRRASVLNAAVEDMPRAPRLLARNAGLLQVGDLVFADASEDPDGVGKSVEITGIPSEGAIPGLHTIAARFDKHVLADGFKGYLQFIAAFRTQLLALAAGTKVLATTRAYVSRIELALPGVAEQMAIAEVLRDADAEIAALECRLETTRSVKKGMMQSLFTGRTCLAPSEAAK